MIPKGSPVWVAVGTMLGAITEIAQYVDNGRRYPYSCQLGQGLFVSPAIDYGSRPNASYSRLTLHMGNWNSVWRYSSYDPDTLNITGPGGVGQLGEWVYWGTMHIPYIGFYMNAQSIYGDIDTVPPEVQYAMYYATFRTTSIWRGRRLGLTNQEIQLVYGEQYLGAMIMRTDWVMVPTGWTPLNMPPPGTVNPYFGTPAGSSGFFNPNNNYSWVVLPFSDATGNHLFFGTMDQTLIGSNDITRSQRHQLPIPGQRQSRCRHVALQQPSVVGAGRRPPRRPPNSRTVPVISSNTAFAA